MLEEHLVSVTRKDRIKKALDSRDIACKSDPAVVFRRSLILSLSFINKPMLISYIENSLFTMLKCKLYKGTFIHLYARVISLHKGKKTNT